MSHFPRITVVTPSFNQGAYLEDTIESVLGQGYPNLEYILMDGGSTDGSLEIIKRYEKHFSYWISAPDGGQAAAINQAFSRATGDILAWLNSDDYYLPGTLRHVAEKLPAEKEAVLFGNSFFFNEKDFKVTGSQIIRSKEKKLTIKDYISQPSAFWTRVLWNKVGLLEARWNYVFDWDWFIRAEKASALFLSTPHYLSAYRIHDAHKTGTGGELRLQEIREIYEKHSPERMVQLFDTCKKNYARFKKITRRVKKQKLSKVINEYRFLKLLFPRQLRGFTPKEIQDMLDVVAPS